MECKEGQKNEDKGKENGLDQERMNVSDARSRYDGFAEIIDGDRRPSSKSQQEKSFPKVRRDRESQSPPINEMVNDAKCDEGSRSKTNDRPIDFVFVREIDDEESGSKSP